MVYYIERLYPWRRETNMETDGDSLFLKQTFTRCQCALSPGISLGMHGKPKISITVSAQPYLRCLALAISLPHSNRQSCNMNMQFYDHSGETHVRTRASYAFRPRRTSLSLFGRKVTNIRRRGRRAQKYTMRRVYYAASSMPRGKFRNSFLGEL